MADGTAVVAWAIPVGAVQLMDSLDAFRDIQPTLRALRLCNRFGKGENVHITRLPQELVAMIESNLQAMSFEEKASNDSWQKFYCCFEGTCRPSSHYDAQELSHFRDLFGLTREDPSLNTLDVNLEETLLDDMDTAILEHDPDHTYITDDNKHTWKNVCSWQNEEVLSRNFGLTCFIIHSTLDEVTATQLGRHDKRYNGLQPDQATISYLILPVKTTSWCTSPEIEDGGFSPPYYGESGNSTSIPLDSLSLKEDDQNRFAHAMRVLQLTPSVHMSQLHCYTPAPSSSESHDDEQSDPFKSTRLPPIEKTKETYLELKKQITKVEQGKWPRLMLLVKEYISTYR